MQQKIKIVKNLNISMTKNQGCQEKIKQKYNKSWGCQEKRLKKDI